MSTADKEIVERVKRQMEEEYFKGIDAERIFSSVDILMMIRGWMQAAHVNDIMMGRLHAVVIGSREVQWLEEMGVVDTSAGHITLVMCPEKAISILSQYIQMEDL